MSSAPDKPPTHWKQVFFPFPGAIEVKHGDKLQVCFDYSPAPDDHRGMAVSLSVSMKERMVNFDQSYFMV